MRSCTRWVGGTSTCTRGSMGWRRTCFWRRVKETRWRKRLRSSGWAGEDLTKNCVDWLDLWRYVQV